MVDSFAVTGIDHVELFVTDWDDAKRWYDRVFGFEPVPAYEPWWRNGEGPLMLEVGAGPSKLALFEADEVVRGPMVSPHRVAFEVDGPAFLSFLDRLATLELTIHAGDEVTRDDVVDHGLSFSLYFTDLDGNRLELTTNEYEVVSSELG